MKLIKGWWLPDTDTHFEHYIKDGGYQTVHRNTILNHIVMNKHTLKNCEYKGGMAQYMSDSKYPFDRNGRKTIFAY